MGVIDWLLGPGMYDKEQTKKRAEKVAKDKKLFGSYSSAADYAMEHREEYESFDEAIDAWDNFSIEKINPENRGRT